MKKMLFTCLPHFQCYAMHSCASLLSLFGAMNGMWGLIAADYFIFTFERRAVRLLVKISLSL